MSIINKLMGNAVKNDIEEIKKRLKNVLLEDEEIEMSFSLIRDLMVMTSRRILFIDYKGLTGRKTEYTIVPYDAILYFTVETAGRTDLDFELKIWLRGGASGSIRKEFKKDRKLAYEIIRILSQHTT